MIYARDAFGDKITAAPNLHAVCPGCNSELRPKCGDIKIWHWSHMADDCDPWHEPECAWHLQWKSEAPSDKCEVVMGPHRADIVANDGTVIELQHSSISPEEIQEREEFYGKMMWIFDANEFGENVGFRKKDGYFTFTWKWPRPTHRFVRKPLIWDIGDGWLFHVKKLYGSAGWGVFIDKQQFIEWYLVNRAPRRMLSEVLADRKDTTTP